MLSFEFLLSGKIRYCQAPARYEIRKYFQRSGMLAAIDQQIRRVGEYYDRQREVYSYLHFMLYVPLILPIHRQ